MKLKHRLALLGAALCLGGPARVHAQEAPATGSASPTVLLTDGEIKRVDLEAGKLTIKHGPIQNLDMPGMTMVFIVTGEARLPSLKAGDKIRFVARHENGKFLASDVQLAP